MGQTDPTSVLCALLRNQQISAKFIPIGQSIGKMVAEKPAINSTEDSHCLLGMAVKNNKVKPNGRCYWHIEAATRDSLDVQRLRAKRPSTVQPVPSP